jgi:chromosome segregation ATPase
MRFDNSRCEVSGSHNLIDKHINALTMTNLGQGKMNEQLREQSNAANRISDKLCYEVDRLTIAHQHDIRLVQEEDQDARQLQDSVNSLNLKHEQARSEYEVQISAFKTRATTQQQVHEQACSDLNTAKCRIRDPEAEATLRKSTYTETRSNLITANSRIQELETALDKARKDRASEQAGFATILGELSTQIQNLRASNLEVDNQVDTLRTQHNQEWSDLLAKVDSLNSQVLSSDESKLEAEAKVDTLLTQH